MGENARPTRCPYLIRLETDDKFPMGVFAHFGRLQPEFLHSSRKRPPGNTQKRGGF
jgi:hypothetical protein